MARIPELPEREEYNCLTTITLALQLLERRTALSPQQRRLVGTALQATERLGDRLLRRAAERGGQPPPAGAEERPPASPPPRQPR
jgi:hypothetical protein